MAEKGVQFLCNTSAKLVTRVQIANGFWLAENTKKPPRTNQILAVLTIKFKKMAMVFCKQRFDFVRKTTIKELKKKIEKPKHRKKYVFLTKCVENAVLREKYCEQKRRKWAIETKEAAYSRLR